MTGALASFPLPSLADLVGVTRVVFGLMVGVKLYFSIDARSLVWAHRVPLGSQRVLSAILAGLAAANACFVLGLFTGPAALAQYVLYLWALHSASLYGLEDVVFHMLCLYFVFAGPGEAFSVDQAFGTGVWGRIPSGSAVPELALAAAIGNVFLSAGVTKLFSPMWRAGLGAYYFFLLPNFRRTSTALVTSSERVIRLVNTAALVMEVGFLPAVLVNAVPLGALFWVMGTGFALSLATIFVLTWIGEAMTVAMLIVAWLLLDTGTQGLGTRWATELAALASRPADLVVVCALVVTLLASLWTALIPSAALLARWPRLVRGYRMARFLARYTWGFLPCDVFTEAHMQGSIVYRVHARPHRGGTPFEVFRIYNERCGPGPERWLRPTFYEVTAYKVSEVCLEFDAFGEVRSPDRLRFLLELANLVVRRAACPTVSALVFSVIQLVPPDGFQGSSDGWYASQPWMNAFEVRLTGGVATQVVPLARPILSAPTGRDLARNSFAFLPMSS